MTEQRWRVGRRLGRTLYLDENCVGMVDDMHLARAIVAACNAAELGKSTLDDVHTEVARRLAVYDSTVGLGCESSVAAELRDLLDWLGEARKVAGVR